MKVTVSFGDERFVVPCGNGDFPISELVEKAIQKYKKGTEKGEDCVVQVKYLETAEHARLDADDNVIDVCDDKDLLTAICICNENHNVEIIDKVSTENAERGLDEAVPYNASASVDSNNESTVITQSESVDGASCQLCVPNKHDPGDTLASSEPLSSTDDLPAVFKDAMVLDGSNVGATLKNKLTGSLEYCNDTDEKCYSNEVIQCSNVPTSTETPLKEPSQKLYGHPKQPEECSQRHEVTLENLRGEHCHKLRKYLDPITSHPNWLDMGKVIFQGDDLMQGKVDGLNYAGGGSSSKAFIEYFKTRFVDYTVKQFADVARDLQRSDIANLLMEKYKANVKFKCIEHLHEVRIYGMLDKRVSGLSNWKSFASKLNLDDDVINSFQIAVRSNDQYSPTEELIRLIKMYKPGYKLCELSEVLAKLERNDVKLYVDNLRKKLMEC